MESEEENFAKQGGEALEIGDDFDSEEERAALASEQKETRQNKKSVQFNIKSNVDRLKKLK